LAREGKRQLTRHNKQATDDKRQFVIPNSQRCHVSATLDKQSLCSGHSRFMALLSRHNGEVFIDQYNFIYTYVASNKDSDKKYWICEKRCECNVRVHIVNGRATAKAKHYSAATWTSCCAKMTDRTDERVSNIVRDYANRTFTEFLRAIAHNLQF